MWWMLVMFVKGDRELARIMLAERVMLWLVWLLPPETPEGREFSAFIRASWLARQVEQMHALESTGLTRDQAVRQIMRNREAS